jgi:UDPglucose 6-dehydrogenase
MRLVRRARVADVAVVGAGYVGLVTGANLARIGHRVTCVDKDADRVAMLREGRTPFYEPDLEDLVARGMAAEALSFSGDLASAVGLADVVFIAVDTPQGEDGAADLSNVSSVARGIGRALAGSPRRERPLVVANKSTVPVGSGDYVSMLVQRGIDEAATGEPVRFGVASTPEFLREGSAVYDSLFPDRIVVGAEEAWVVEAMREIYGPVIEQSFPVELDPRPRVTVPFVVTDLASAEMIKYAANAFLATKVSFINEISDLCALTGADVGSVATGIGLDNRIGPRFLNAGIGWGGSCLPKDVAALRAIARAHRHDTPLLDATTAVNDRRRDLVVSKLLGDLGTLEGKHVALLGLAFKPNTDDLREAPSLAIAERLSSLGATVVGYDPVAAKAARGRPGLKVAFDPYEALGGAHAALVATEWEEVRNLDLDRAASLMREPRLLVDGRNAIDPDVANEAGLLYRGFGRG